MKSFTSCCLILASTATAAAQDGPSMQTLIDALSHRSAAIRLGAADRLGEQGAAAAPALARVVRAGDRLPAATAAALLVKLAEDGRPAAAALREVLGDGATPPWRWYLAAYVLPRIDDGAATSVLPAMTDALRSGDAMKQYAAVQLVYDLPAERATAPLRAALWELLRRRDGCFQGVYLHADVAEDDLFAYSPEIGVYDAAFRLRLDDAFVLEDSFILEALYRAGERSPERLLPPLRVLAQFPNAEVRLDAARQLARLGSQAERDAVAALRSLFAPYLAKSVRREAAIALGQLGPVGRPAAPELVAQLGSADERLRASAAVALGRIGPAGAGEIAALRHALALEQLIDGPAAAAMQEALARLQSGARVEPLPPAR